VRLWVSHPYFQVRTQILALGILSCILAALCAPLLVPFLPPPGTIRTLVSDGDTREYYLFVPPELPSSQRVPLVFMLQGFDTLEEPSGTTRSLYWNIAAAARRHAFIAVFPRGMKGSFPDEPGVLAWCPEYFIKNRSYIIRLVDEMKRQFAIDPDRIILAGFSNGAYFASVELTTRPDTPFTGFWLDAGGYPYAFNPHVKRHPVFITRGALDIYNASYTLELSEFLASHGWQAGSNLFSETHEWAHVFNEAATDRAIDFLLFSHPRTVSNR